MAKGNKKSTSKSNVIVSNDQQYEMTEDKHGIFRLVKEDGTESKRYQMLAVTVPDGANKSKLISEKEALRLAKEYSLEIKDKVTQPKQKAGGKITRKKVDALIKLALDAGVDQEKIEKIMGFSVEDAPAPKSKAGKAPKKAAKKTPAKKGKATVAPEESEAEASEASEEVEEEAPKTKAGKAPKKAAKKAAAPKKGKKALADLVATEESQADEDDEIASEEAPPAPKKSSKNASKRSSSKRVKRSADEEEDDE